MSKRIFATLAALGVAVIPLVAHVWFNSMPSGVAHNDSYYVEAEGYTSGSSGDLSFYKNSSYIGSSYGNWSPFGTWQSDPGPDYIEYYAEHWDTWYWTLEQAWHYVDINAPANTAPYGVRDYSFGSAVQYGNFHGSGWAVDDDTGAPVTRVDILIDGNDVGDANLGGYRPDVASAFGRSDFTYSAWNFDVGVGSLSVGTHSLELRAWDSAGASSTFGYTTFSVTNDSPSITLLSPSAQTITIGTALEISSNATDGDGNIVTHNLDIQRPDASWNWEGGFAYGEPYLGGPVGSAANSTRSAWFTFNQIGTWYVRSWVNDANGNNLHSATVAITVLAAVTAPATLTSASVGSSFATFSWTAGTASLGVKNYKVFRNGTHIGTTTSTHYTDWMAAAGATYAYTVKTVDNADNESAASGSLSVNTLAATFVVLTPTS